jgi:predicted phosphohydrolase
MENRLFLTEFPLLISGDILLLAGDITIMHKKNTRNAFFDFVSDNYQQVYWLAGNHEYYQRDMADFNDSFDIPIRKNVSLVNNTVLKFNNIRFIFTTLWSHIKPENASLIEKNVMDFEAILNNGSYFTVKAYNNLHKTCLNFLKSSLEQAYENTVVITHHLPALSCNSIAFMNSKINDAFCVDLTSFIENSQVKYWIYGHSHYNQHPFKIGKTTLLTNQLGYVKLREHKSFQTDSYFESN